MARIYIPDMETCTEAVKGFINYELEEYFYIAVSCLKAGKSHEDTLSEYLDEVKEDVQYDILFWLEEEGYLVPETHTRMVCGKNFGVRHRTREHLDLTDVPDELLEIETYVPEFRQMVEEYVIKAEKQLMMAKIEDVTEVASR